MVVLLPHDVLYECPACGHEIVISEYTVQTVSCTCDNPRPQMDRVTEVGE